VALWWLFSPVYPGGWLTLVIFALSLVLSFVMRFVLVYALGMVSFWTTRVSAIFNLYFAVETILSGRLVPQALLPEWAQRIENVLPFRWSFGFPIEVIIGKLTLPEMVLGLGIQLGWLALATVLFVVGWNAGIKRYSAVGA
jgi:ABC-2 type transport system permease protein